MGLGRFPAAMALKRSKHSTILAAPYLTHEAARQDLFHYIDMFHNPTRKHRNNGMLSPVDLETGQQNLNEAVAQETRGT